MGLIIGLLALFLVAPDLAVSPFESKVVVGQTVLLVVSDGSGSTRWSSADPAVATVTRAGTVRGLTPGTTTITARRGNRTGRATVIVVAIAPPPGPCGGSVLTASSWTAVADVLTRAQDGDTVRVAPGEYRVTTTTAISEAVCLEGSGVTLVDNTTNTAELLSIAESVSGAIVVRGFLVQQGTSLDEAPSAVIRLTQTDGGHPVVIRDNSYRVGPSGNFLTVQTNRGVISGNTIVGQVAGANCLNNASFARHKIQGVPTWAAPPSYGTADSAGDRAVFYEGNTLTRVAEGIDLDDNARAVIRRNTFTNSAVVAHGADTSPVGMRSLELYGNTFVRDATLITENGCVASPMNNNGFIALRGGTALIFDNVIPDIGDGFWGDKSEVSFFVEQLRRNAGSYACWTRGYPAPHQPGWGFQAGATVIAEGVAQDLEPIYLWGNTGEGNHRTPLVADYAPNECGAAATAGDFVKAGREFVINTPRPGYVPHPYPHPLTRAIVPDRKAGNP
jgi:hypothetical protein